MTKLLRVLSDDDEGKGDTEGASVPEAAIPEAPADTGVDLAAWARGRRQYPFHKVAEIIKGKFALVVTSPEQAIAFLADQGFTTANKTDGDADS